MKRLGLAIVLVAAMLGGCAELPEQPQVAAVQAPRPWEPAQVTLRAAQADVVRGGLRAVQRRAAELETALAGAGEAYAAAPADGSSGTVLADGMHETLAVLAAAAIGQSGPDRKVEAVADPYPAIAFLLGSYYNEIGRPADALRVLDAGLALPGGFPGEHLGRSRPLMAGERGVAFAKMKRWSESLAAYDGGLALPGLQARDRARLLRGRGFALIELNRVDEAETAFRDSLKAEPGNPLAFNELLYITQLRQGGASAPMRVIMPNQPGGGR